MNIRHIKDSFWRIGARAMAEPARGSIALAPRPSIEIARDERGELFRLLYHPLQVRSIEIVAIRPAQRRLLALIHGRSGNELRFLCGRDGLGLFTLALPESSQAHSIEAATEQADALALAGVLETKCRHRRPA